jgi:F-type H+-transporting ATPase subunit delta
MSLRTSAKRYARALFDVAITENAELAKIDRDLSEVAELFRENAELMRAATAARVPDASRKALVEAIAARLGVSAQVKNLLILLADSRKLDYLHHLAEAYRERLLQHQNIIRADVTSAAPLTPEKTTALAESLSNATGKQVELSVSVDPELLGGVVARIGSTVYDGSVRTQLQRMRQELIEQ